MEKENIGLDEKCISTNLIAQVEVVCLLSKCKEDAKKNIEYREEEIPDCECIYG